MSTPIVFIDTETTSLRPDRRAWDIAMIRRDEHGAEVEAQFFVHITDLDLGNADQFSLDVGRFWERHPDAERVRDGGRIFYDPWAVDEGSAWDVPEGTVVGAADAAHIVSAFTHRAHLVGAVPNFDAEVLAALLRDNWLTPSWHYHLVDVETLAVGWLARDGRAPAPPWRSDDVAAALGVDAPGDGELHTALGDARWARRIYDRVMGGAA